MKKKFSVEKCSGNNKYILQNNQFYKIETKTNEEGIGFSVFDTNIQEFYFEPLKNYNNKFILFIEESFILWKGNLCRVFKTLVDGKIVLISKTNNNMPVIFSKPYVRLLRVE